MKSSKGKQPKHKEDNKMMKYSRSYAIEEVATMIRTGASEKTVGEYIDTLYKNGDVTERVYSILLDMFIENY